MSFFPYLQNKIVNDQWLSTKQAAELLGVSQRTVQNWVDDGKLKSSRTAGGHRRLNPSDVSNFLQNNYLPASTTNVEATELSEETLRVLMVEDDFNLLRLCELRFSQFSVPHQLYLASNAFQSLIMIGRHQPHLIFTDLKMPQVNGLQMINEIVKLPEMQNTRIVIVTGLETREVMNMGNVPDGVMVLPKPIPFNTVETILYQQARSLNFRTITAD